MGISASVVAGVLYRERLKKYDKNGYGRRVPDFIRRIILSSITSRGDITRLAAEWGVHPCSILRWRKRASA